MLLLAVRLKWIFWDLSQSFSLRLAITIFTIVLLYSVGQVNVVSLVVVIIPNLNQLTPQACVPLFQFTCLSDHPCTTNFTTKAVPDLFHHDPAAASSASSSVLASHETHVPFPDGTGAGVFPPPAAGSNGVNNYAHRKCALPQYISLSAAFSFLTVSIFLRYSSRKFLDL